ncbi:unnamed protein product [Sphagnum jensenii]
MDVLILSWENKFDKADISEAMVENVSKLKAWSPLIYYGTLSQLIGLRALSGRARLQLKPVGNPHSQPGVLKDLAAAVHDILHDLVDLHKQYYTHRDLRWEKLDMTHERREDFLEGVERLCICMCVCVFEDEADLEYEQGSAEPSSQGSTLKLVNSTNEKLAFSLKQKTRLFVNAIKLGDDNDRGSNTETEKQLKKARTEKFPSPISLECRDPVPPVPSDQEVKKAADKLASFGMKNGHQFENFMHQKNPGNTPFQYAFRQGNEYKYYEYHLAQEELALSSELHGAKSAHMGIVLPVLCGEWELSYRTSSKQLAWTVCGGWQQQTRYETPPASAALFSGAKKNQKRTRVNLPITPGSSLNAGKH